MAARSGTRETRATARFDLIPSRARLAGLTIEVAKTAADAEAFGIAVPSSGDIPAGVGVDRALLLESGFSGALGQTLVLPRSGRPVVVAIGVGEPGSLDASSLRDAAAAFARAAARDGRLATSLADSADVDAETAGQAIVEGVLMARYRYRAFIDRPNEAPLTALTLVSRKSRVDGVRAGAARGRVTADAVQIARDLCNAPATHLTATRMAEVAGVLGAETGLGVEIFDKDDLVELGCGGLLGVNMGSDEPPRMIKLTYRPAGKARGHLALVGKGIMYDAGGISLKPSDAMHFAMKQDMSGAAAVLGSMLTLKALGCRTAVTGYLMCTDNMPSGKAMRLGDVLTIRGGKTVEVFNTDAEGRLVMADALVLASELDPSPDSARDHRDAHRRGDADLRDGVGGHARQRPEPRRSAQGGRRPDRRAGVGAAARQALPAQARLSHRRHQEPRRRERRDHHRRALPRGVHRRHPVRPPGHLRSDDDRRRRFLAIHRGHRLRDSPAE